MATAAPTQTVDPQVQQLCEEFRRDYRAVQAEIAKAIVGHEPANAEAEVRRSFEAPQYANQPLYQAAYLLGGLQLRGLRKELVDSKVMTNKQFHDEIMRQGNMPIALIRLGVTKMKLTRDMDINWKFYGDLPSQ